MKVTRYQLTKDVYNFVDRIAASKIKGFYPSAIRRAYHYNPEQYIPILESLVIDGQLEKQYIVKNIYDSGQFISFNNVKDIPIGDYIDVFPFTDEFLLTEDLIDVFYKVSESFKEETKEKYEKKQYQLL